MYSSKKATIFFILSLSVVCYASGQIATEPQAATTVKDECHICDPSKCPPVTRCNLGVVRDQCGCCDVCGLEEGQLCNMDPYKQGQAWYGHCGVDLECRLRSDIDPVVSGNQSICYCVKEGLVCGSDDQTYTWCRMKAAIVQSENKIKMISKGPCKSEPKILNIAKSQTIRSGSKVTFICEVEGFPMPTVAWYFRKPGFEEVLKLPGDSDEISVSFRGGPQPMRITAHLQITKFMLKHEGKYQCMADNDMGMAVQDFSLVHESEVKKDEVKEF